MHEHIGSERHQYAPSAVRRQKDTKTHFDPIKDTRTRPRRLEPPRLRLTLQSLDDQGRSGGDDRDGGLTVLDGELDGHAETLPVAGGLGDVFSDLLGGLWWAREGSERSEREGSDVGEASQVSEEGEVSEEGK